MDQSFDAIEKADLPPMLEDEVQEDVESSSSLWLLIALGFLALLLIWIFLGVWRYLQVLGHGTY